MVGGDCRQERAGLAQRRRSRRCSPGCLEVGIARCTHRGWMPMKSIDIANGTRIRSSSELRQRYRDHEPLNSGSIQRDQPSLHAAAVRHFASYDQALIAAKLDPQKVRERRSWKKEDVIRGLKSTHRAGRPLSDSAVRREHPALYGAAVRLFGSFTVARSAAGIQWKRRKP